MKKIIYIMLISALTLTMCSCASKENRRFVTQPDRKTTESEVVLAPDSDGGAVSENSGIILPEHDGTENISESTETAAETSGVEFTSDGEVPPAWSEGLDDFYYYEYAAYSLTWAEREFTTQSLFVGDSICRGFSEYHIVPTDCVFARGSVAARNFFDFMMNSEENPGAYTAKLAEAQPRYVFLSMGMNDINLTDEKTYCENYRAIIDMTLDNTDAEVYVAAITPIDSEFSSNYRIDCFNLDMEKFIHENYSERVHYIDFAKHLKDGDGNLKECFNGGDGIHLSPYAYYVALWEMNRTITPEADR